MDLFMPPKANCRECFDRPTRAADDGPIEARTGKADEERASRYKKE
jgi:hypothetical protein